MPTYEYSCAACNTRQEVQQKMTDPSLTVCPACGAPGLRKLFTNVGVVFKGSGFYRNDSRDSKSTGETSSAPAAEKSASGSDSSSTSSAPAAEKTSSSESSSPKPAAKPAPASTPATTAS